MAALSHGADGFIPKPCRTELALCRVAAVMRLCESVALAKQARYDGAALYNETEITLEDAMAVLEAAY